MRAFLKIPVKVAPVNALSNRPPHRRNKKVNEAALPPHIR